LVVLLVACSYLLGRLTSSKNVLNCGLVAFGIMTNFKGQLRFQVLASLN